jgi:hypothetical protein
MMEIKVPDQKVFSEEKLQEKLLVILITNLEFFHLYS